MKSLRTGITGLLAATVTVLLVASGCGQKPPPASSVSSLASPDRPESDVLERDPKNTLTTMEDLLTNRIPGVVIRRSRGHAWIEIRGPGSIAMSTEALIVVDGVENSSRGFLTMNPADVQRIQVLKGASAAIYGMRGGNGVLIVTTRRQGQ